MVQFIGDTGPTSLPLKTQAPWPSRSTSYVGALTGFLAARYGGEEFVILLPESPPDESEEIAESVRQNVFDLGIEHESSSVGKVVTVGVGVAAMVPTKDSNPADLIKLADEALYKAKANGRNCTSTACTPE